MLSIRVRNWCICSGYASVPDSYAQRMHQLLTRMLRVRIISWCICSAFFEGNALCARISTYRVRSVNAPVPDSYAQRTHQFLTRMLSASISSWRACSVHTSILTRMLRVYKMNIWKIGKRMRMLSMCVRNWYTCSGCASVPNAHAQGAHQFLTRMLSVRIKAGACA
jgi:hypothetical protein